MHDLTRIEGQVGADMDGGSHLDHQGIGASASEPGQPPCTTISNRR